MISRPWRTQRSKQRPIILFWKQTFADSRNLHLGWVSYPNCFYSNMARKYLNEMREIHIIAEKKRNTDIRMGIGIGKGAVQSLNKVLRYRKKTLVWKKRMPNCDVISVLGYGNEYWTIPVQVKLTLEVREMNLWRRKLRRWQNMWAER